MELTKEEKAVFKGEQGETLELAYKILVATREATNAERLVPIEWSHLSGVNYNTIGDAGEEFLSKISQTARVKVKTTLNPMGFDIDNVSKFNLDENFIKKQQSIKSSYERMGVTHHSLTFRMKYVIFQKKTHKYHSQGLMQQYMQILLLIVKQTKKVH